ncbi:hypothetical protein [Mesorhizobium sp. L48C026A00]|uniref:hypothetical protein n=1 Tax=Mesorhizobium sp. L48C026A00 TaxID=1287182 RepID=UPI0003CFF8C8|nr:hypothetical protein [Mesorhizobium sp. L48C026A00]ESZ12228.1 hypothetical protein X737_27880 [Mesorhizobium sp. L48C026A00]
MFEHRRYISGGHRFRDYFMFVHEAHCSPAAVGPEADWQLLSCSKRLQTPTGCSRPGLIEGPD